MGMTIDQLARETNLTARTIRNYQTKGLVPPPALKGRTGLYDRDHVSRLQLIKEMQTAGFNLAAIRRLLDTIPPGAGEEALRFEQTLLSPWSSESPQVISAVQLAERFRDPPPDVVARAERLGVIKVLEDGRVELPVPSLIRAGQQVMDLGIPLQDVMDVTEILVASSNRVAAAFAELFLKNVWRPFEEAGRPAERWQEVRDALERLRPIASEALLGAFQARMKVAVEESFGAQLDDGEKTAPG